MDVTLIVKAVSAMGGLGLLLALFLFVAAKKFAVKIDLRVEKILEFLPGLNCGACGFTGCEEAAEAVVSGEAPFTVCPVGGGDVAAEIASFLGLEAVPTLIQKPWLRCRGGRSKVASRFEYDGITECVLADLIGKGDLACTYGCLGFGDCAKACHFGAIEMGEDQLPHFNEECVKCGICVDICPRSLIALIPGEAKVAVACSSLDKGKVVRSVCSVGCIACKACEKVCEPEAIKVVNNLAVIDYEKCTACLKCVEKCPTKCIIAL